MSLTNVHLTALACLAMLWFAWLLGLRRQYREYDSDGQPNVEVIEQRKPFVRFVLVIALNYVVLCLLTVCCKENASGGLSLGLALKIASDWPTTYQQFALLLPFVWVVLTHILFGAPHREPEGISATEQRPSESQLNQLNFYHRVGRTDNAWIAGANIFLGTAQITAASITTAFMLGPSTTTYTGVPEITQGNCLDVNIPLIIFALGATLATGLFVRLVEPLTGWLQRAAGNHPDLNISADVVLIIKDQPHDLLTQEQVRHSMWSIYLAKTSRKKGKRT